MRALVTREGGSLELATLPDPTPEPGQLVLRVERCGICGTDLHLHRSGLIPAGQVMGHEFSGEVMETVGALEAGSRVAALPILSCGQCKRCRSGLGPFCEKGRTLGLGAAPGAYAEFVAVAAHETVRLPEEVDADLGALVEPLAVALHALNAGRLRRGDRCLILGAGPIGLATALWARHFGAERVVVSEPDAGRRALALEMGATEAVDPEALGEAECQGLDAQIVVEASGAPGLVLRAIEAVGFRGRIVVAGLCLEPESIPAVPAMVKEASLHYVLAYEKDDFQYTVDRLAEGRIDPRPMVDRRVGLADAPAAFDELGRPGGPCKVLIDPRT